MTVVLHRLVPFDQVPKIIKKLKVKRHAALDFWYEMEDLIGFATGSNRTAINKLLSAIRKYEPQYGKAWVDAEISRVLETKSQHFVLLVVHRGRNRA